MASQRRYKFTNLLYAYLYLSTLFKRIQYCHWFQTKIHNRFNLQCRMFKRRWELLDFSLNHQQHAKPTNTHFFYYNQQFISTTFHLCGIPPSSESPSMYLKEKWIFLFICLTQLRESWTSLQCILKQCVLKHLRLKVSQECQKIKGNGCYPGAGTICLKLYVSLCFYPPLQFHQFHFF